MEFSFLHVDFPAQGLLPLRHVRVKEGSQADWLHARTRCLALLDREELEEEISNLQLCSPPRADQDKQRQLRNAYEEDQDQQRQRQLRNAYGEDIERRRLAQRELVQPSPPRAADAPVGVLLGRCVMQQRTCYVDGQREHLSELPTLMEYLSEHIYRGGFGPMWDSRLLTSFACAGGEGQGAKTLLPVAEPARAG